MREVEAGVPLPGLYPSNAATKARYERLAGDAAESDALSGGRSLSPRGAGGARDPVPEHAARGQGDEAGAEDAGGERERGGRGGEQRRPGGRAEVGHQPPDAEEVGPADGGE